MVKQARKKINEESLEIEPALMAETAKPVQKPVVIERHQVVRRWKEEKPLDEAEDDFEDDLTDEEFEDRREGDVVDPIAKAADEISGSSSIWSFSVFRLPNYERDNRTDSRSRRLSGTLPVPDEHYIREQLFLDDLQKFARGRESNWFLLVLRRDNRIDRYLPPFCVDPPLPDATTLKAVENGNTPINIYNPYPQPTVDGFKQFIAQAKQFAELRDLLLPANLIQQSLPTTTVNSEPLTDERALLHILNRDEGIVDTVVSKLRGLMKGNGIADEKGPWDAVVAALTSPTLPTVISQLVAQFKAQAANSAEPPQPQFQQQQLPPDVAAYQIVLRRLIDSLKLNGEVESVIAAIDGFLTLFPQHQSSVEGLINLPPEQALQMLAQVEPSATEAVALPHAVEWVQRLRDAYFQTGDNPDGITE